MSVRRRTVRSRRRGSVAAVVTALLAAVTMLAAPSAGALPATNPLTRITDGSRDFWQSSVSDDGRFVLYNVDADNGGFTNGFVALRDRKEGTTRQVGPLGADNGEISADGSTVIYRVNREKTCDDIPVDVDDVYRWKRATGTSTLISPDPCVTTHREGLRISADGTRAVSSDTAYEGDPGPTESVTFYDATGATTTTANVASGFGATISGNGRFIAYLQFADELDAQPDLYLHDRNAPTLPPVSLADGANGVAPVSNDGRYVTYEPASGSVVSLDRTSGTTTEIDPDGAPSSPDMTPDGRYVAFAGDGSFGGVDGAGIWDRTTGNVETIGSAAAGFPAVSADGAFVSFESSSAEGLPGDDAHGAYDVFLWNRPAAPGRTMAESFVTAAYQDYIGRAPTPAELTKGLGVVGNASSIDKRSLFTIALSRSDTYLGAVVNKLYLDTLGRPGDTGGVAYWTDQLRTGKVTVAQTAGLFYASAEYYNGFGEGDLSTWITDLYDKVLLRQPDSGGLAYYIDLAQRTNRYTVAYPFYQSVESSETRTKALYQHFLGRAADSGGLDYWSNRIPALGDVALASNLTLSIEYLDRAATRYP